DEIIIVDDGSTDKTFLALKSKRFPCEHKILRLSRGGIVNALNRGIELSTNEFIARFDVDDRYHTDRIDFTLAAFTPEVCAVFGTQNRSYAMAMRLEGLDGRWRATQLTWGM
ncbi:MAG: glycosyltransferase family 2 protein, partial [Betaproteobacteria bacterium]|nr:glycosyltransferase family 2 protein [Betaproteobacteria bacterium]